MNSFTWAINILTRNSPHHLIMQHLLSCQVSAIFPSQRPGADPPLQGPAGTAGEVAAPDLLHSDTSLNSFPVSPDSVLDVPAQLHPVDLVVLQHLVSDSGAVVLVLINTVQTKLSGFLDQTINDKAVFSLKFIVKLKVFT